MHFSTADLQRLTAEEPFVRALAVSLLAEEADDVVQQAFLRALASRPAPVRELRAWLARIVRNLVADQRRGDRRRAERERVVAGGSAALVPSSAELCETEERRRALVAAVDALPEHLRTVVLLRWFEGLPPRRVAATLGLAVPVVWNRLHAALARLRERLDAAHGGDRRAWMLPLVPLASSPRALPWRELAAPEGAAAPASAAATVAAGAIVMTSKTKVLSAAAAFLVAAFAWFSWPALTASGAPPPVGAAPSERVAAELPPREPRLPSPSAESPRAAVAVAPPAPAGAAAGAGELIVDVRYVSASVPAAGVHLVVGERGGDFRVGPRLGVTDATGTARFEALMPGSFVVSASGRSSGAKRVDIVAGTSTRCELVLQRGYRLDGLVVDADGVPVANAHVEVVPVATVDVDAQMVARTGVDGTFVLEQCQPYLLFGARAHGHAASKLHSVRGDDGAGQRVRIELRGAGGSVDGVVLGPDGHPVADAVVRVGHGQTDAVMSTDQGAPPLPAQVRTDAAGRFVAVGLPPGTQPLQVRAAAFAPWAGTCEVLAGGTTPVRVMLQAGVTCRGTVLGESGEAVAAADVRVGERGAFAQWRAETAADGTFVLRGLPAGEVTLTATRERVGKASVRIAGDPGGEVQSEIVLSQGLALRGRVVDEEGRPLRSAQVHSEAEGDGPRWSSRVRTDADGAFVVADCPRGRTLRVVATRADHVVWQRGGVDPRAGALAVTMPRDTSPRARITGRLLGPDGAGAVGVTVSARRQVPSQFAEAVITEPSGVFALDVAAGAWSVNAAAKDLPAIRRSRTLAPGEHWDLGTLRLAPGGTLVVHDDPAAELGFVVYDAQEKFVCGVYSPVPPHRSELLAPGDYRLLVKGSRLAAMVLPFTIRAGEETVLEVRPPPGVRVNVTFVPPPTGEHPRAVFFSVHRDGRLTATGGTDSDALTAELWLATGRYELVTRDREPVTTHAFTVGEQGVALRVALR